MPIKQREVTEEQEQYIKENLEYRDGDLYWREDRPTGRRGVVAGTTNQLSGYRVISLDGYIFQVHRIIYFLNHDKWPNILHHRNHVRNDNRIENLESVTHAENMQDRVDSKSRTPGVEVVTIRRYKAVLTIGMFDTEEEAADAIERCTELLMVVE